MPIGSRGGWSAYIRGFIYQGRDRSFASRGRANLVARKDFTRTATVLGKVHRAR